MGNCYGSFYRTNTFGESHGYAVGALIEGIPGNIPLDLNRIQAWLNRRKPGQSPITTPRQEKDILVALSGLQNGLTLGSPLCFAVLNEDQRPKDYSHMESVYRPSHGDWSWEKKYGIKPQSGGGRLSARETIGRVISGAVAEQILEAFGLSIKIVAWVDSVKDLNAKVTHVPTRDEVDQNMVRCPDIKAAKAFEELILEVKSQGDSVGGTIRCLVQGVPPGLGEPVFSKLEAELAKAMLSLPASKSFEIGEGLSATLMRGSEHNDGFTLQEGNIVPASNRHGGTQGGISTGLAISFRVGFKPVSTLAMEMETLNKEGQKVKIEAGGRHDPCVLPRAVPIVESMAYLVILDLYMAQKARMTR
jgi:chorismate synthase